jgi:tripartite-type tricarboxylate transporter receptor subunit TctC
MNYSRRIAAAVLSALMAFAGTSLGAHAAYPDRPVKIVVPFAPGGTTDFTARLIGQALYEQTGKPFVIENRTGATGTIGNAAVARSAPDGYTLMMADTTTAMVPWLYKQLPFDLLRDLQPLSQVISTPMAVMINPGVKANTLAELIALAKAAPGSINYGSGGVGSNTHLGAEMFRKAAGIAITHVPYRGAGDALQAVLGGQVQLLIAAMPTALPHATSGRVRVLAVTSQGKRVGALPDVPTTAEAGLPAFTVLNWFGLMAPAKTPKEILSQVHGEVVKALANPEVRSRISTQGAEPVGSTPEEFTRLFRDEVERWGKVIKETGVQPE